MNDDLPARLDAEFDKTVRALTPVDMQQLIGTVPLSYMLLLNPEMLGVQRIWALALDAAIAESNRQYKPRRYRHAQPWQGFLFFERHAATFTELADQVDLYRFRINLIKHQAQKGPQFNTDHYLLLTGKIRDRQQTVLQGTLFFLTQAMQILAAYPSLRAQEDETPLLQHLLPVQEKLLVLMFQLVASIGNQHT